MTRTNGTRQSVSVTESAIVDGKDVSTEAEDIVGIRYQAMANEDSEE
jgi:hypothetical protein